MLKLFPIEGKLKFYTELCLIKNVLFEIINFHS